MKSKSNYFFSVVIVFLWGYFATSAYAQIDVEQKAKDKTIDRADQRTGEGIDKGLDAVEDGVKSLFKKKDKSPKSQPKEDEAPAQEKQESEEPVAPAKQGPPTLTSYSKFDFIPGQKVIFFEDFSQDNVGDFPALWFSNGSGEVVTLNNYPGKWLNIKNYGCYYPEINLQTGENFTVEFDLIPIREEINSFNFGVYFVSGDIKKPDEGGAIPGVAGIKTTLFSSGIELSSYADGNYVLNANGTCEINLKEKVHVSYWIQKTRMRIYLNEKKVVDAPRIVPAGYKYNILRFEIGSADDQPFLTNVRVAAGLPDTRNKLLTEGKLVTYGINFDVNSDKIKPESYGTLKEIANILNEVPDVKVKICGHTDSDGDDAKNLDLSKRRAVSVKNELAKSFGVNAGRIETDGFGESRPIAPNDTPANKAQNRRVEFIKL